MDIMGLMELMNYNYESRGTNLYEIYGKFIDANSEIMTEEMLEEAKINLLPPSAFTDDRKRKDNEYENIQNKIQTILTNDKGRSMTA